MKFFHNVITSAGIALVALAACPQARAQSFLEGRTLQFAFAFPTSTTGANSTRTVGPGIEFSPGDITGTYWTLDVNANSMAFTFVRATMWTTPSGWVAPFTPTSNGALLMNGLRMSDNDGSVPELLSFQLLSGTTLPGFTEDRVRVSANTVLVDFSGLNSVAGDQVIVQLSPVPELSTWLLLSAGSIATVLVAQRTKRRRGAAAAA
jgi:hypothetical protein